MNGLETAGLILLALIVTAGIIVKRITRSKLNDIDGLSDMFASGKNENIIGKF